MKVIETTIPDVKILGLKVFGDECGFFFESFNQKAFEGAAGVSPVFVQDNHSKSVKRVLHYMLLPKAQGKLVRVLQGEVFDVAVDNRKSSPTFCHRVGEALGGRALISTPGLPMDWVSDSCQLSRVKSQECMCCE